MLTEYKTIDRHIPATMKRACQWPWSKPGGPEVTADLIERGDVNEQRLIICAARMNKIIEWDK